MIKVDLKKIFYMDYLIHIRKTGTAAEFATKVGVARSTFFEYMDYMRNELNIVILYDRSLPKPIIIVTKGYTIH